MNRRTLAFRGGGLVTATAAAAAAAATAGGGAGGAAEAWERQDPEPLNGRGADEEVELEGLEAEELEAGAEEKELLLPQEAVSPPAAGPTFAERNRRTLAFRGGGGLLAAPSAANNGCEAPAWPRKHFNGRGADEEMELEGAEGLEPEGLLEGKELVQDGGSLSDSSDDEEDGEGGSLGDGSGAEGGSCSSSRRSGGDGGDEAEGSSVGAGEGESIKHFPLARPKSLLQKLHISFQGSWLKEFPWLYYCQETGLMSCAWCTAAAAAAAPPELIMAGGALPGGHDELCKGTRNYKRALLLRHHLSAEHRLNEPVSAEQVGGGGGGGGVPGRVRRSCAGQRPASPSARAGACFFLLSFFFMPTCDKLFKWLPVFVVARRAALARRPRSGSRVRFPIGAGAPAGSGQAERCQPRRCAARERLHELPLPVVVPGQRYLLGGSERRFRRVISSSREDKPATWEEVAYEYQCCGTDLKTLVATSSCGTGEGRVVSG